MRRRSATAFPTPRSAEEKSPAQSAPRRRFGPSSGLLQRDGVPETLELRDEAFGRADGVAAHVIVPAGVAVGLAGAEHVPRGDEDRVRDRRCSAVRAAAYPHARVLRGEVAVLCAPGGLRGLRQRLTQPLRALARASGAPLAGRL